jgi:glucosaminylphosphatidylinositol acyltransferase
MLKTIKNSYQILVLGLIRLLFLLNFSYSYNDKEYGRHWNFFFTIFAVKILSCPFEILIRQRPRYAFILANIIGIVYQYCLYIDNNALTNYLTDNNLDRSKSLLVANKEGIFSTIGFLSIFFHGEAVCLSLTNLINRQFVLFLN